MSMTDPIADLLTRIRNGAHARKDVVDVPYSRVKEEIVRVITAEGFLVGHTVVEDGAHRVLRVALKYDAKHAPVITGIKRVSRPSLRRYVGSDEIPMVRRGLGVSIVSTPAGILSDREARKRGVGGEVMCSVW
jgi:small subunit ribosomal protein S8